MTKAFTWGAPGREVPLQPAHRSSVPASAGRTPQARRERGTPRAAPAPRGPQAPPPAAASSPATAGHLAVARRQRKRAATLGRRRRRRRQAGGGGGAREHRWEQLRRAARRAGGCFLRCGRGRRPGGCGGRVRLPRRLRVSVGAAAGPVTARRGRRPLAAEGPRWLPRRGGISRWVHRPTPGPWAGAARPEVWPFLGAPPSRPWAAGTHQSPSSCGAARQSLLHLSKHLPLAQVVAAKAPVCPFGSGRREFRELWGHSLTQICIPLPHHLAGTCNAVPVGGINPDPSHLSRSSPSGPIPFPTRLGESFITS